MTSTASRAVAAAPPRKEPEDMDERRDSVFDIFEQAFLLGLGAASLTKEKAEHAMDELIRRGRLTREEGRKLARDLTERGAQERVTMRDEIRRTMQASKLASKADVRRLEAEIAEIRSHLGMPPMRPLEEEEPVPAEEALSAEAPGREAPEPGTPPELSDTER